jgi:DNA helicase HerA-like ATPase
VAIVVFIGFTRDERFDISRDDLLTHAVVLGATGSGKTGLLTVLAEGLAREGLHVLALDVKGDLANLARRDSAWEEEARREGVEPFSLDAVVYAPGIAGCGALRLLPPCALDELSATWAASAILSLTSLKGDLRARALLTSLLREEGLTLEALAQAVLNPPNSVAGGVEFRDLLPEASRRRLAGELASLAADPLLGALSRGPCLDLDKPPLVKVVYLAHLPEELRMAATSLLLSHVYSWAASRGGSSGLRLAVVFDEVRGYLPPYPRSPPSKESLAQLVRQGRGFGVSVLLATQNPRDLDYRILSNAGFWAVGLLRARQDREAVAEVLSDVSGEPRARIRELLAKLGPREFLVLSPSRGLEVVKVRHTVTPLRGPVGPSEVKALCVKASLGELDLPQFTFEREGCPLYRPLLLVEGVATYKYPCNLLYRKPFRVAFDPVTGRLASLDPQRRLKPGPPVGAGRGAVTWRVDDAVERAREALEAALVEEVFTAGELCSSPGEGLDVFYRRVLSVLEQERRKVAEKYAARVKRLEKRLEDVEAKERRVEAEARLGWVEALGSLASNRRLGKAVKLVSKTVKNRQRAEELREKKRKILDEAEELRRKLREELAKLEEKYRISSHQIKPQLSDLRFSVLWVPSGAGQQPK